MREEKNTIELDLKEVFKILVKRIWIIALCAVIVGASVYGYLVNFVPNQYRAKVTMYINNNEKGAVSEGVTSANLTAAQKLVDTYVEIIKTDRILDIVVLKTGLPLSASEVRAMISADAVNDTAMFEVSVTSKNAATAYGIAMALAEVAPNEIPEIIDGSYAILVDEPKVPYSPVPPRRLLKSILGAIIGALCAAVFFVLRNVLDTHVRTEEELERIGDIPVLGTIPDFTQPIKEPKNKGRR